LEYLKGAYNWTLLNHTGEGIFFTSEYLINMHFVGGVYFSHEYNKPEDWFEKNNPTLAQPSL
jgi:hypothetical protein